MWTACCAATTKRGNDGLLNAEDVATYEKMEADVVALGREIDRLERQAALDRELEKPLADPLTGRPVAPSGEVKAGRASDDPPFVAIGFMSQPSPGRFRFVWLYKGKFALVQDEYATATDSAAWRLPKLSGTFVKREHDGKWQIIAESGDSGFTGADFWFKSVYPSAPVTEPEEKP